MQVQARTPPEQVGWYTCRSGRQQLIWLTSEAECRSSQQAPRSLTGGRAAHPSGLGDQC